MLFLCVECISSSKPRGAFPSFPAPPGGQGPPAPRFEFPERPGALSQFLDTLNHGWNVSLFHYRNHGADIGRVLVGVQVPPDEVPQHRAFLDRLGYVYHPETENPVYQQFMR